MCLFLIGLLLCSTLLPTQAFAEEVDEGTRYYLGEAVNAGDDDGYSKSKTIKEDDPHFGWKMGSFFVSGYTRATKDTDGNPIFLKNVGDVVTLWFCLEQNIDQLNGFEGLSVCEDENGYDEYFGIEKTNFGRGTLIIKHIDYQNHANDPVVCTDYLAANAVQGQEVKVEFFEEGDYEIALNYELHKDNLDIFGWNPFSSDNDYRIFIRFSVRNGNCMVFPFDVTTKEELLNTSFTENGFYLDLAYSRYLDIDVKKEVLNETGDGLVEDIRFNRPAKDGDQYTEEGIYTITVSNQYTNQQTVKKIYVGTNDVMKAHAATGLAFSEINYQLSTGASVGRDGTLIPASGDAPDANATQAVTQEESGFPWIWVIVPAVVILVGILLWPKSKRRRY